jgi:hypothetical protein
MSETPPHTPDVAAAVRSYSAADLACFAGAEELAAGAALAGREGSRLRARLLADEMAAGHCVMMRLAARTNYAMNNAAGLGGSQALPLDLAAARFAGMAGRLMDQYRRGLLSLSRLDAATGGEDEEEWMGVSFEGEARAAPEELERRLARAKAARAAGLAADRGTSPPSPAEQAAAAAAEAAARRLVIEARADRLGVAAAPDRARLFLDQLSAGHRMAMRLAGRTDWQMDRLGAPAVDAEPTQRAILRLSSAMARLMERVRLGFLALDRAPSASDPGGGPRKVAGYYWIGETDMLAPANDVDGQKTEAAGQNVPRGRPGGKPGRRPGPAGEVSASGGDAFCPPSSGLRLPNRGRLNNGNPGGDFLAAPRCGARTRAGCSCRQPAMANGRCRFHGGKSTGPRTEAGRARARTNRLVHGLRSAELIALAAAAAAAHRRLGALLAASKKKIHHRGHRDHREDSPSLARAARNHPSSVPSVSSVVNLSSSANRSTATDRFPAGHGVDRSDSNAAAGSAVFFRSPAQNLCSHPVATGYHAFVLDLRQ